MDLTSLGVGSCVGTGMYLVAGMVARKFAGPGVVISFIIAALASIFSGKSFVIFLFLIYIRLAPHVGFLLYYSILVLNVDVTSTICIILTSTGSGW